MTDPARAARLWLVSVGGEAEADAAESAFDLLAPTLPSQKRQRRATRLRAVAIFRQGLIRLVLAMIEHAPLPFGRFIPEPWPTAPPLPTTIISQEADSL